jgi:hypothetical protein
VEALQDREAGVARAGLSSGLGRALASRVQARECGAAIFPERAANGPSRVDVADRLTVIKHQGACRSNKWEVAA